jgi:hypothetical protein
MNRELKAKGVRMMAMNPGWVKTEFFNHALVTNSGEVQYYNRLYEAKDVVATGLKDLYRSRKDYSVHGFPTRMQVRLVKLLPHSMVMNTWLSQQKKAKKLSHFLPSTVRPTLFLGFFCWLSQVFITMLWGSSFTARTCIRTGKPWME